MATVEDLDLDALVRILTEPKNALTKQYARMFEMDHVSLVFTPDSLEAIAEQALRRSTGARGLRAIMEEVLLNTMYDLPSRDDVEQVLIDRDVVEKKVNPTLVPVREVVEPTERSA
jgi:ATP-dependent Clp protease ATP-binding subunit ClpX